MILRGTWFLLLVFAAGFLLGVIVMLPRRHKPPCKNGEVEIFYYNTRTGEHFSNCTYIIPSR